MSDRRAEDHIAFYVGPWTCSVDGEVATAQPGDFCADECEATC